MYPDEKHGIRRTIISFNPFFCRKDIAGMTDAQIGKKFGLSTQTVRSMRMDQDIPFETIKTLCHALECQPGDIMEAMTAYYFPATKKGPNT